MRIGDESWFSTKVARDAAIARMRMVAVERGLSVGAAHAGIYKIVDESSNRAVYFRDLEMYEEDL